MALALGAAACGGSTETEEPAETTAAEEETTEETTTEEATTEEETTEEGTTEEGTTEAAQSDAGGDEAMVGAVDEAGLTAAGDRFLEFIRVLDDGNGEAACAFFLDPTTGQPVSGPTLTQCGETLAPQMETMQPGSMDVLDRSMVETTDNGDGTVGIALAGSEFPYAMVMGSDGMWYLSLG